MTTARQKHDSARQLRREAERDRRAADRVELRKLRAHIRHAKRSSRARVREVVATCRQTRELLRERTKAIRADARARANAEILALRAQSRTRCEADKAQAHERGSNGVQRAIARLEAERKHHAFMRLHARPKRLHGQPRKRRAIETVQESDATVANDIPDNLLAVWSKVKGKIKGSPRRTRTEAFLEWVAENQGDVRHILDAQHDADTAELIRNEKELRARVASPAAYRRMSSAELAEVPF